MEINRGREKYWRRKVQGREEVLYLQNCVMENNKFKTFLKLKKKHLYEWWNQILF